MTRQFCRKKWGKNDHILGKIRYCVAATFQYILRIFILEQKKAVSKMSKLCLGALTSVDQMETKLNEHQPMEKFKRLSEDSVKLNSQVQQSLHDMHLKMERLGKVLSVILA